VVRSRLAIAHPFCGAASIPPLGDKVVKRPDFDQAGQNAKGHAMPPTTPYLRLRIVFGKDAMLGPGKAELLEHIRDTGSIAAAGRAMKMSYKRAWMLVETLNTMFREPLVDSTRGGLKGGGAVLTAAGQAVLAQYRRLEAQAAAAAAAEVVALTAMLRDIPEGK